MEVKLDKYETEIEDNISQFEPIGNVTRDLVESIIDKANEKKNINLQLRSNDLEQLKRRADMEGLPYQILLSSIVHKFISYQLVDKRSILRSKEAF